ncbi:putative cohesin subunit rad21 [Tripterygium wilfordii]|uniref:Putative cohesin subunit rad21 n=1 Tax=Tripterygium wilfordii TaxID=458696 RepID=A0A7J7BXQ4_TRIWF|nr:sister chromatid cohesion 1 protein 4-like isoform X2 [Tripterygium wilfordii]KAF5726326.1 putative cohesin subunit rad21 [Tripterygium wilfordii]
MFYSQFILAKKGPLGTIWIAAHLERKLRKNQVADTDIGVSVDSILFPEVPIALRLSSHLLLGVVRIYSRKVNYLFDDCSEALLKIKQAFRSTAVDLPPEESIAPYHSITLPETFDLDDFELPDNELFQGNYVDHHVSTREQITLQDTTDGVVYSTLQFGLDERFGDGDTSQIGLDLDEELILERVDSPGHDGVSQVDPQASVEPIICMETGNFEIMPPSGSGNQVKDQAANSEHMEYAQTPSTPGLVDKPNLSSVKEVLGRDDQLDLEDQNSTKLVGLESRENGSSKSDPHQQDTNARILSLFKELNHDTAVLMQTEENGCLAGEVEVDGYIVATNNSNLIEKSHDGVTGHNKLSVSSVDKMNGNYAKATGVGSYETVESPHGSHAIFDSEGSDRRFFPDDNSELVSACLVDNQALCDLEVHNDGEININIEESHSPGNAAASDASGRTKEKTEAHSHQEPKEFENLDKAVVNEEKSSHMHMLMACNSHMSEHGVSSPRCDESMLSKLQSDDVGPCSPEATRREDGLEAEDNQIRQTTSCEGIQANGRGSDEQLDNAVSIDFQFENVNSFMTSDFPEPEKLLSVPEGHLDKPNGLLANSTTDTEAVEGGDGGGDGTTLISGKKRSFTECSLTVESMKSVESFGLITSKRTAETIPDDDDLLSSILVGRKSSVMKMKPTPLAPEVASMKRARSAPWGSILKRKVLMDDAMVLHGDIIRQQLTNTDGIRRVRKKAPCTYAEISMIQRQFLDEEIFKEPIPSGMPVELIYLHSEPFDLSGIQVSENDDNNGISRGAKDLDFSVRPGIMKDSEIERSTEPLVLGNEVDPQQAEITHQNESQQDNDHHLCACDTQGHTNAIAFQDEHLAEIVEMEIDQERVEVANGTNHSLHCFETSQSDSVGDNCKVSAVLVTDVPLNSDALCVSSSKIIGQPVVVSLQEMCDGKGVDATEIDHNVGNVIEFGKALRSGDELEDSKIVTSIETKADAQTDDSAITGNENMHPETGRFDNLTSLNGDKPVEEVENNKLGIDNQDVLLDVDLGNSLGVLSEGPNIECTHPVEFNVDVKDACMDDGTYLSYRETDPQSLTDEEIAAVHRLPMQDCRDVENVAPGNDTEFLNVDDDDAAEEDDDMPCAEEIHLLENSGWSSRTRAVAKYLQVLFDKEAVHGRKFVLMDNLLAGKTRKEASRMFFETLVLKTKDYVHVEQERPFDNINIKPRVKFMKSILIPRVGKAETVEKFV